MTDTRYYSRLPSSCARELFAFIDHVRFWVADSADGWLDLSQRKIAAELGVSTRTVKRWELALVDLGICEVKRRCSRNRRQLRLRRLAELPAMLPNARSRKLREWGHACHHCSDTRVTTVDSLDVRALNRARVGLLRTNSLEPKPPPAGGSEQARRGGSPEARPARFALAPATVKASASFAGTLNVGRKWWPEVHELVRDLARFRGEDRARRDLEWIANELAGEVNPKVQGKRALGMLRSVVGGAEEKSSPRSRALAHA